VRAHLKNKKAGKKFAKQDKIINKTYNVDDYQPKSKDDLDQGALAALPDSMKAEVLGGMGKLKISSSKGGKKAGSRKNLTPTLKMSGRAGVERLPRLGADLLLLRTLPQTQTLMIATLILMMTALFPLAEGAPRSLIGGDKVVYSV
jgi:hypothetical protein